MAPGPEGEFYTSIVTRHALFTRSGFTALVIGSLPSEGSSEPGGSRLRSWAALVLIVATILFGESVNGARLWLQIGPVRFQPSEIARF